MLGIVGRGGVGREEKGEGGASTQIHEPTLLMALSRKSPDLSQTTVSGHASTQLNQSCHACTPTWTPRSPGTHLRKGSLMCETKLLFLVEA